MERKAYDPKPLLEKTAIASVVIRLFCRWHPTALIAAMSLTTLYVVLIQRAFDTRYDYDIRAFLRHERRNDKEKMKQVLLEHAHTCAHFDPNACLCSKFCPDCQHGRNY